LTHLMQKVPRRTAGRTCKTARGVT
jgi:hypothetical protein